MEQKFENNKKMRRKKYYKRGSNVFRTDPYEWREITELSDKQQALKIMSLCEITYRGSSGSNNTIDFSTWWKGVIDLIMMIVCLERMNHLMTMSFVTYTTMETKVANLPTKH